MLIRVSLVKFLAVCLLTSVAIIPPSWIGAYGSSIPIWEFLTRNEKISYLYSTFAQLVSLHCKATAVTSSLPVNQCKHDLLNYGFEELQTLSDNQLDNIDPYQRGANELIWSVIMRKHPDSILITTRKPLTTRIPLILDNREQSSINNIGQSAITNINTNTNAMPISNQQNPIFENDNGNKHQYAMDMDMVYGYPYTHMAQNPQIDVFDTASMHTGQTSSHKTYLTGPLVIRVKPDGTPVEEDKYKPIPKDDDLEIFGDNDNYSDDNIDSNDSSATTIISISNKHVDDTTTRQNNYKHRKIATISRLREWIEMRDSVPMTPEPQQQQFSIQYDYGTN